MDDPSGIFSFRMHFLSKSMLYLHLELSFPNHLNAKLELQNFIIKNLRREMKKKKFFRLIIKKLRRQSCKRNIVIIKTELVLNSLMAHNFNINHDRKKDHFDLN